VVEEAELDVKVTAKKIDSARIISKKKIERENVGDFWVNHFHLEFQIYSIPDKSEQLTTTGAKNQTWHWNCWFSIKIAFCFKALRNILCISRNVKDIAGNSLPSDVNSSFTTALAPGTGTLPNGATLTINPKNLFANGEISTTVTISNINVGGTPVPNGTLVAVTAAPALNLTSAGGMISGPSVGTSVDTRFLLFETEGASVTLFYTPPEADWLTPGATANGIIQVASVDSDTRPANLIVQDTATLYRLKTAGIAANPATLPADGSSQSTVEVVVTDNSNNLVPDGTEIGITVAPVFVANSAGGTILGGTQSGADSRVRIFSTTKGRITFVYQSPSSRGPGYATIQAVTVNNQGAPTGLINSITINLN
jgi:hypothetical protein